MKLTSILLLILAILPLSGCTKLTGSGEKVGSVIKVAHEGLFFKTDEVEIVRGGMSNGSGGFSTTPLKGTVNDDALLAQLKDALNNQYEVKVQYRDYFYTPLSSDSDSRYIVAVQKLDKVQTPTPAAQTPTPAAQTPAATSVIDNPIFEIHNESIVIRQKVK